MAKRVEAAQAYAADLPAYGKSPRCLSRWAVPIPSEVYKMLNQCGGGVVDAKAARVRIIRESDYKRLLAAARRGGKA